MLNPIINGLLEAQEGDERTIDFYLTGLLQPLIKPYGDIDEANYKKVLFAVSEFDVRKVIKDILKANHRHIEMLQISDSKNFTDGLE